MRVRSSDGAEIAVECSGSGRPLVLVHGTLDDHRYWEPVLAALTDRFAVFLVNRRGRCNSSPHSPDHSVDQDAEDIAAVLKAIAEPAHLMGHSSGARYALHAALLVPELLSLTLYEPPPFEPPPSQFLDLLRQLSVAEDKDGIVSAFWSEMVGLPSEEIEEMRGTAAWEVATTNAYTLLPELRSFANYSFDPTRFVDLGTPTLVLSGTESPPFLRAEAEALVGLLPRSRSVHLDGQGHEAVHTAPGLFVDALVPFLDEHTAPND